MSKITAVLFLSTCLVCFGFGYIAGESQQDDKLLNVSSTTTDTKQTKLETDTPSNRHSVIRSQRRHDTMRSKKRSTRLIITDMKNSLGSDSKMLNIRGLFSAWNTLDGLSESQLANILSEVTPNNFNDQTKISMFMLVTTRLAEMNPAKAMEMVQDSEKSVANLGQMSVMEVWSESDPVAAYEWYKKEKQAGNLKDRMFGGSDQLISQVFAGLAAQNPELAFFEFDKLDKNELLEATRGIALNLQTKDEFVDMINRISDDKGKARKELIGIWLAKDPMVAADWAYENADDKQKALNQIVSGISGFGDNAEVAAEWLLKEDRGNVDDQWVKLVENYANVAPKGVVNLVANIQDKELRKETLIDLIGDWKANNMQEAKEFIDEADLTDEMRKKLNEVEPTELLF